MRRVIFDFFSVCLSNKLTWVVKKRPIDFDNIMSVFTVAEQKSKMLNYVSLIEQNDLAKLKAEDRNDFIWGVQPYMKEIISKMIYEWEGSDSFWSDCEWGLDINAYYSKKLYFLPNGLPQCYSINDFVQVGFWEAASTSGGLLKFKKIRINEGELSVPLIDKKFFNIHDCIAQTRRLYLSYGYEIQQVSDNLNLQENEFVLNIGEIFEVTNFMYAKEDLAETFSLLQTNNIKYLINKNKEFCFGDVVRETFNGKLDKVIPDQNPLAIEYDIAGKKGKASTNELLGMYENRLDLIHKNGQLDSGGMVPISSLVKKEEVPLLLNKTNLLLDTFVSTSAGMESIREIYKHLMLLAELIYEKGIVLDGGIKPVKYAVNNQLELPYILDKVDTNTVDIGGELVPYNSKIEPVYVPYDIPSEVSIINRYKENAAFKPKRDIKPDTFTKAQDNMLGKKNFLDKIKKIDSIVVESVNNGLPKFNEGIRALPQAESFNNEINPGFDYNMQLGNNPTLKSDPKYTNDGLVSSDFDYNLSLNENSFTVNQRRLAPYVSVRPDPNFKVNQSLISSIPKQYLANDISNALVIPGRTVKRKRISLEEAKRAFEEQLEKFNGEDFIVENKNKINEILSS